MGIQRQAALAIILLALAVQFAFARTLPMTVQPCGDDQHGEIIDCGGGGGWIPSPTPSPSPTPQPANDSRYYDANGNLVIANGLFFEYNGFNRLARVRNETFQGPIIEEYIYDENGDRIAKIEPQLNQTTYYPSDDYTEVVNDSGTFPTKYYYENNILVARKDHTNTTYYYHPDHLGSTDLITDQQGQVVEETVYEPLGAALEGATEASGRFTYTGKEQDSGTGLYYYGARYYDARIGQFIQPDSVFPDAYNPQALNRFAYTLNNPYKYVDPTGNYYIAPWDFLDCLSFADSVNNLYHNPGSLQNWVNLGIDAISLLPIIPSLGVAAKLTDKAADAKKGIDALDTASDASKTEHAMGTTAKLGNNIPLKDIKELPKEAQETLKNIKEGGPFPYSKDGKPWRNDKNQLPVKPTGYYKEYTVDTPGSQTRGSRRMVVGAEKEIYYTDNHYETFVKVKD